MTTPGGLPPTAVMVTLLLAERWPSSHCGVNSLCTVRLNLYSPHRSASDCACVHSEYGAMTYTGVSNVEGYGKISCSVLPVLLAFTHGSPEASKHSHVYFIGSAVPSSS